MAEYCRSHGLTYVYFTSGDLERETDDQDRQAIAAGVAANPELERVFQAGIGTVYRVLPGPSSSKNFGRR